LNINKNIILRKCIIELTFIVFIWIIIVVSLGETSLLIMGAATFFANLTWMLGFWYGCDKDQITLYIVTFGVAPTRFIIYTLASYISLVNFGIKPIELGTVWAVTWMSFAIPKFRLMIELGKLRWSDHYKKLIGKVPWNE